MKSVFRNGISSRPSGVVNVPLPKPGPTVPPFAKLFSAGLATILGVQAFVIIGGVTRVIPLTGITLPFVSYGGSSIIANFVLLALLLLVSNRASAGGSR